MSGIIYLPQSAYVSDGNSSPLFTGSLIVASMTLQGGVDGAQVFRWVCGLNAAARYARGRPPHSVGRPGSSIVNVLPSPGFVCTRIDPPWRSTTRRAMASPRPLPESLR